MLQFFISDGDCTSCRFSLCVNTNINNKKKIAKARFTAKLARRLFPFTTLTVFACAEISAHLAFMLITQSDLRKRELQSWQSICSAPVALAQLLCCLNTIEAGKRELAELYGWDTALLLMSWVWDLWLVTDSHTGCTHTPGKCGTMWKY